MTFLSSKLSDIVFIMLISVKMPINMRVGVTEVCSNDPGHMTRMNTTMPIYGKTIFFLQNQNASDISFRGVCLNKFVQMMILAC